MVPGGFATVLYGGTHPVGTEFSFIIDYSDPNASDVGTDFFGLGIGTVTIPIPAVAWLFPAGLLAGLGWMRRRS